VTALIGTLAMISYVFMYTPAKKKTPYAVFLGAIPGALPPLMGQTTVTGDIQLIGLVLFGILFFWQLPHFMAISLMYSEDYKNAGIVVFPNTIGLRPTILRICFFSIVLIGISYLPTYYQMTTSHWYSVITLTMGMLFCGYAFKGLRLKEVPVKQWSRKFFFSTLLYLPIQLGSLLALMNGKAI
jgi:protoheme IX farnesyltransferase